MIKVMFQWRSSASTLLRLVYPRVSTSARKENVSLRTSSLSSIVFFSCKESCTE
jgi:hypothetical protein